MRDGKRDLSEEKWNQLSEKAKDLINKLLIENSKMRIQAEAALDHSWLKIPNNKLVEDPDRRKIDKASKNE